MECLIFSLIIFINNSFNNGNYYTFFFKLYKIKNYYQKLILFCCTLHNIIGLYLHDIF